MPNNESERSLVINQMKDKNPSAFKPRIEEDVQEEKAAKHAIGCNCTRSNCLKKYCECFKGGIKCTESCRCRDCKNNENHDNELISNDNFDDNDYENRFISTKTQKNESHTSNNIKIII